MKLIIDIPEEVVKAVQNGEDYRYDIHTTIAQGTSVSTEGDLISRGALKEHKFVGVQTDNLAETPIKAYQQGWNDAIDAIIDNEPTVKSPCDTCIELECENHGVVCPHYRTDPCVNCQEFDCFGCTVKEETK